MAEPTTKAKAAKQKAGKKTSAKETKHKVKQQVAAKKQKKEAAEEKKPAAKKKPTPKKPPKPKKEGKAKKEAAAGPAPAGEVKEEVKEEAAEEPKEEATKEPKKSEKKEKKEPKPKPVEKIKATDERKLPDKEKSLLKSKPKFQRPETSIRKRLNDKWRRPRGIDSKQLEGKRGKGALPSAGYKKPDSVSGLVKGFKPKRVFNPLQVEVSDPKKEAIIIAACVGRRKRNEIIKAANQKKITILNPRKGET